MNNLGEVIAIRKYSMKNGQSIIVSFGKPKNFPDSDDVYCPYQIVGIGKGTIMRAGGIDGVQALIGALKMAKAYLEASPEYKAGEISWIGSANSQEIGFPID